MSSKELRIRSAWVLFRLKSRVIRDKVDKKKHLRNGNENNNIGLFITGWVTFDLHFKLLTDKSRPLVII